MSPPGDDQPGAKVDERTKPTDDQSGEDVDEHNEDTEETERFEDAEQQDQLDHTKQPNQLEQKLGDVERAKALKLQQSTKKQKITKTAKKLHSLIEGNNDPADVKGTVDALHICWSDFESVHQEYFDLVSSNDALTDFAVVNGLGFEDYQEGVHVVYQNALAAYNMYESENHSSRVRMRGQVKRLQNLCDSLDAASKIPSCNKSTILCNISRDFEPMANNTYELLIKFRGCKNELENYQDAVDNVVARIDDLKLYCNLHCDSELSEAKYESPNPCTLSSSKVDLPSEKVAVSDGHTVVDVSKNAPDIQDSIRQDFRSRAAPCMSSSVAPTLYTSQGIPVCTSFPLHDTTPPIPIVGQGSQSFLSQNCSSSAPVNYSGTTPLISGASLAPFSSAYVSSSVTSPMPQNSPINVAPSYPTVLSPTNFPGNCNNDVHVKRTKLPEFSGLRRDWPEFKTVWRELAERTFTNRTSLAYELKNSLRGVAKDRVRNIYITRPEAYELIWQRLSEYYDDCSASVQSALESLYRLRPVEEDNFKGVVYLVDEVEDAFAQLKELGQTDVLSMREIDRISELLPISTRMLWIRQYHQLEDRDKVRPLEKFMKFLQAERASVTRLAELQKKKGPSHYSGSHAMSSGDRSWSSRGSSRQKPSCAVHQGEDIKHTTIECKEFEKLSLDDKYATLRKVHACFKCFGYHRRDQCRVDVCCDICKRTDHLTVMCRTISGRDSASSSSHTAKTPASGSLYAIFQTAVAHSNRLATIFCDNGSSSSYISHRAASRLGAKSLGRYSLDVTTMGNVETKYDTRLYEVVLKTKNGADASILAFGMDEITGPVSVLDKSCLKRLFPGKDPTTLQRSSTQVDILLGCDYFGLHPKRELCSSGLHLSIMEGELGVCIQGYHPDLRESTKVSSSMVRTLHSTRHKTDCNLIRSFSHTEFACPSECLKVGVDESLPHAETDVHLVRSDGKVLNFIQGEELATEVNPKCGGCRCNKCPTVGHTYSFHEEQELRMIRDNLKYDEVSKCWTTSYPWLTDPSSLPDNYCTALATLRSTEATLKKDSLWATKYSEQIQDMLDRNVARLISDDELKSWTGPKFYISHLAVKNPRSQSTPVRIVFNSSQMFKGISLNSVLAKGPDAYLNNLLGLLLRWREGAVAVVGDIKKMFHSVHLETTEQHCHRFLWRDLEVDRKPDIYMMLRVNMGDRPAPAICTEALYSTAEKFKSDSPEAAAALRQSTYVDDILDSFPDIQSAKQTIEEVEKMLLKGGFKIKCWQFSRDVSPPNDPNISLLKSDGEDTRVLGVSWRPEDDAINFKVALNFSPKKKGERSGPNLKVAEVPSAVPMILTRRTVLQQVMMLFDPLGFVSPFSLQAKLYLRETWSLGLNWDDALPENMHAKWLQFFTQLFELEGMRYDRSLTPPSATVSAPSLILFSDGSDKAYGFVAYIRWELSNGGFWCRLVMAKCRIAPLRKLTTPQMELNGAVLSKRGRKVIEKEMRFNFGKILHIVDSETVLNMINKTSTRFRVFEGVRIGEIQNATCGDMSSWAWMAGEHNSADLVSRGCSPERISPNSEWWKGPPILYKPMDEWNLKYGIQRDDQSPGEKTTCCSTKAQLDTGLKVLLDYSRYSNFGKVVRIVGLLITVLQQKSFKAGLCHISPKILQEAELKIAFDVQSNIRDELGKKRGKFISLQPLLQNNGLWTVGSRLAAFNPMTPESEPQVLLPTSHPLTRLVMKDAHESSGHRGRDATLARFRQRYWTPYGGKLAWSIKASCQLCRLREPQLLNQEMGPLPLSRLKPALAFTDVMVDLFGPYRVRGEVNKRSTGKAYGVLFTDLVMRAVHIEAVFGYDVNSFLLALSRFASVRGWPAKIYSDPGSQLVGVDRELKDAWLKIDHTALTSKCSEKGLQWIFGPADSPWHQGAVESLVKAAKRSIHFAVHNQRLSPTELLTVFAEVSNLLNERPIGGLPGPDAEISILTPNCLLLGRATAKNPGGWQPQNSSLSLRYHLVQNLVNSFWERWTELCAPGLVVQRKWHTAHRNLKRGDVVVVADRNVLRGDYRLGLIKEVFPDSDGKVRKVSLVFKANQAVVTRAVQRLALLVPVDERTDIES